jgi:hypothetical protein
MPDQVAARIVIAYSAQITAARRIGGALYPFGGSRATRVQRPAARVGGVTVGQLY